MGARGSSPPPPHLSKIHRYPLGLPLFLRPKNEKEERRNKKRTESEPPLNLATKFATVYTATGQQDGYKLYCIHLHLQLFSSQCIHTMEMPVVNEEANVLINPPNAKTCKN